MTYSNGREAKQGDNVLTRIEFLGKRIAVCGVVTSISPEYGTCSFMPMHPVRSGYAILKTADCIHLDDALEEVLPTLPPAIPKTA